jgi:hypothetical protein
MTERGQASIDPGFHGRDLLGDGTLAKYVAPAVEALELALFEEGWIDEQDLGEECRARVLSELGAENKDAGE